MSELRIPYPFRSSRLIYIGLSESKQNSIGRRMYAHLKGQSGNVGIKNYVENYPARFTFHTFALLQNLGSKSLYELESFFLSDFAKVLGTFPICNNQSGVFVAESSFVHASVNVRWEDFD